jgi:hypothetical protein
MRLNNFMKILRKRFIANWEYKESNPVFNHPLRVHHAPDCTLSAVALLAHPALEEAFPREVRTGLMGGEQEVLRVPRRVTAKSFADFRAWPRNGSTSI